ncbi:MAG: DUF72 domain-containing protein [Pirellulaceae bacterium]|nr:DUF72 domain-containing protein [Pirellulaceae bacterium]
MMVGKLFIGCPVWACEAWKGLLFTSVATRSQWLPQYSTAFNTVEGNSSFYALPSLETALRWRESVQPGFRFALKMPRAISHECRLLGATADLQAFLAVAEVLHAGHCLGPSFLQMPPDYSPRNRPDLESFLRDLPKHLPWAVEVRHPSWFDASAHEKWLDELLRELNIDKVIFDSRPLYSKPPGDDSEKAAQVRKPQTPVRQTVTGRHPFLRLIGRTQIEEVQPWIHQWAPVIAQWLANGLEPFVFTHAPDDRYAPPFARQLYAAIGEHLPQLAPPPLWPAEKSGPSEIQLTLF